MAIIISGPWEIFTILARKLISLELVLCGDLRGEAVQHDVPAVGHACGGEENDFRRDTDFRIVIGFLLTFEDDIPVHLDRDYEI